MLQTDDNLRKTMPDEALAIDIAPILDIMVSHRQVIL
jgi:hypothetical protein